MQNVANPLPFILKIDGEIFSVENVAKEGRLLSYERNLNLSTGILERTIRFQSTSGKTIEIRSSRLVSFAMHHIAAMQYEVTCSSANVGVEIFSFIDAKAMNKAGGDDPRLPRGSSEPTLIIEENGQEENSLFVVQKAPNSGLAMAVCATHKLTLGNEEVELERFDEEEEILLGYKTTVTESKSLVLEKYIAFNDSRQEKDFLSSTKKTC